MNDEQRAALVEEIEGAMHEYADVYERAMHGFTWNQKDVATAKNQAVGAILAAVREAMMSEEAVAHYIDAVERAGVEDDPEPTYEESARLSAAFWLQAAGITESEVE